MAELTNPGLTAAQAAELRKRYGFNEVEAPKASPIVLFAKKFWGPSAWMIEIIAALSALLHRAADFYVSAGLLVLNSVISYSQERRAEAAVEILKQRLQISARCLRDGVWRMLPARELVPGDVVRLRPGNFVPADLKVSEESVSVDQSALTGESAVLSKSLGDLVYSGALVRRGECTGLVMATGSATYFGKTIQLVQTARAKLHMEEVVSRLVKWLFLAVGTLVLIAVAVSFRNGIPLLKILPLSLVLLMSAVPIALPVMFTVSTAAAAKDLGRKGVLVTHLSAAEDAATMDVLCVDKTGTLTRNRLAVTGTRLAAATGETELIEAAAQASDAADQDPIDMAILEAAAKSGGAGVPFKRESFVPFAPETRRTEALVESGGVRSSVTKGAVPEVLQWAGAEGEVAARALAAVESEGLKGNKAIGVAASRAGGPRKFLGVIFLADPPRADARDLITRLRGLGLEIKMLTGDAEPIAAEIASQLGLGGIVPAKSVGSGAPMGVLSKIGGLSEVYPETKFQVIEALQLEGHVTGMTGDGVNDAPSLKKAEVGIAVCSANDAAKAAASVVLTTEGLSGIVDLIESGRAVYQRILTWMINKVAQTVLKSGFVVAAYFLTGRFVISALAMLLLVFLTDFAKIALARDPAKISKRPDNWNVAPLAMAGAGLGALMTVESLFALFLARVFWGLNTGSGQVLTFSFVLLLFMSIFLILSVRERGPFWASMPGGGAARRTWR